MAYPASPPPPPPHGFSTAPAPARKSPVPWIVGGVVAVVLICCGGFVAIGIFAPASDEKEQERPAAAGNPAPSSPAVVTTTTTPPTVPEPVKKAEKEEPAKAEPEDAGPAKVTMPKLVGMNAAVAKDKLIQLGWSDTKIKLGTKDTFDSWVLLPENWTVTAQSEKAGAKVEVDTLIVLTCTKED